MKFIILFLIFPVFLFAGIDPNNQADSILYPFISSGQAWRDTFIPAARWILIALATIDFVIEFGYMAVGGQLEFGAIFVALIRKIMTIGFFLMLFEHGDWLTTIPDSFSQLANNASGGVAVSPDTVLNNGILIVKSVWDHVSVLSPGDSVMLVVSGAIMLIAFGLMAAQLFATYVKTYLILAIAPLVFSLGGLSFTRSYAANPIIAIIKAGMELMLIKLFMAFAVTKLTLYAAAVDTDTSSITAMVGTSILLVSVVHMIPGIIESVMTGSLGSTSTAGLGTAASVAGGMAAGAKSTAGMASATKAAASLAGSQGATGLGKVSQTMKNLGSAAANDIRRSMSGGNYGGGTMGGRMANEMSQSSFAHSAVNATKGAE